MVELLQQFLGNLELLLGLADGTMTVVQTLLVALYIAGSGLILLGAKVLNLLARVLDLGKTEGSR